MSIIGTPSILKDIVSYQEESIISRELIQKKVGTITVFAFAQGQGLSEHTAPFDAFVQVLDGTLEITIAGDVHTVTAGQFVIMPAHKPHALKASEQSKMLLVMIRG